MSDVVTDDKKAELLRGLEQRKALAVTRGQVDNSRLYAGSPMYYYCKHCGLLTETLPESHMERPKAVCDECDILIKAGFSPALQRFP